MKIRMRNAGSYRSGLEVHMLSFDGRAAARVKESFP
jgi:hypothetical protein